MIRKLTQSEYRTSSWSGGTTTQIAIFPPEAEYADRDFLWRVSSAAVELEESDFTALPDYERLISTLKGEIRLTHKGGAPLRLRPLEIHAFSGADATHSRGRCTDFNLMLRRGRVSGTMEALRLTESPAPLRAGTSTPCPPPSPCETTLLYCVEGIASVGPAIGRPPEAPPSAGAVIGRPPEAPLSVGPAIGRPQPAPACQSCHPERSAAEPKDPFLSAEPSAACPLPCTLSPGEALLLTEPAALTLTGPAVLMLCRMRVL